MSTESDRQNRDLDRVNTKTREERREGADRPWKINPIETYETKLDHLTEIDRQSRLDPIRRFANYLDEINQESDYEILGPRDAVRQDVENFVEEELDPDPDISDSTVAERLGYIKSFYKSLNEHNAFAGNPVTIPLEEFNREIDDNPDRPYVPVNRIRAFLSWLDTPFARAAWILGFKLGIRSGELLNTDICCIHIDHPIFYEIINKHDITLHNMVRNRPDTLFVYGHFNAGDEINGEVRREGNKRKQDNGSVLPLDSESKTALIDWLLVRPSTEHVNAPHPLFTTGPTDVRRISSLAFRERLWARDSFVDSIRRWQRQESLAGENCPTCGEDRLTEFNLKADAENPGRRYECSNCQAVHWRSIFWAPQKSAEPYEEFDETYETAQLVKYHQGRHSFSSAHSKHSDLHDGTIPKAIRTKAIRGDSNDKGDTEDQVYIEGKYQDFENDVREVYLDNIWNFNIYDDPIPAVGDGWDA